MPYEKCECSVSLAQENWPDYIEYIFEDYTLCRCSSCGGYFRIEKSLDT